MCGWVFATPLVVAEVPFLMSLYRQLNRATAGRPSPPTTASSRRACLGNEQFVAGEGTVVAHSVSKTLDASNGHGHAPQWMVCLSSVFTCAQPGRVPCPKRGPYKEIIAGEEPKTPEANVSSVSGERASEAFKDEARDISLSSAGGD